MYKGVGNRTRGMKVGGWVIKVPEDPQSYLMSGHATTALINGKINRSRLGPHEVISMPPVAS